MLIELLERTRNVLCLYGCQYALLFKNNKICVRKIYFLPGSNLPDVVSDKNFLLFNVVGEIEFYVLKRKLTLLEWARCRLRLVVCVDSLNRIDGQKLSGLQRSLSKIVTSGVSDIFLLELSTWGQMIKLNQDDENDEVYFDLHCLWEKTRKPWRRDSLVQLHAF